MSFHEKNERRIRQKVKLVEFWAIFMGLVNALLCVLLVVFPEFLVKILLLKPPSDQGLLWLRGIGVLLGAMSLAYFRSLHCHKGGKSAWFVTAVLQGLVSLAVIWLFEMDLLPGNWLWISLPGLPVAVLQMWVIHAGWLASVSKWRKYRHIGQRQNFGMTLQF